MDMRDVGSIYYLRDNKLMVAKLNPLLNGNSDYSGLTMKQYEDFLKGKRELLAEGKVNNEEISAFNYALNNTIVEEATKPMLPDVKNMRPSREIEKQAKSKSNRISKRLETQKLIETNEEPPIVVEDIPKSIFEQSKNKPALPTYNNWDEALEDW
jgi:hypothetical protein